MKTKINLKRIVLSITLGIILYFSFKNSVEISEKFSRYSNEDCLTANIYFEAKGENLSGKQAVAAVVYNRHKESLRVNPYSTANLCSVIFKPRQFSWTHQQSSESIRKALEGDTAGLNSKDRQAYLESRMIAQMPSKSFLKVLPDRVLWYHSVKANPGWAMKMKQYKIVGQHVFYFVD